MWFYSLTCSLINNLFNILILNIACVQLLLIFCLDIFLCEVPSYIIDKFCIAWQQLFWKSQLTKNETENWTKPIFKLNQNLERVWVGLSELDAVAWLIAGSCPLAACKGGCHQTEIYHQGLPEASQWRNSVYVVKAIKWQPYGLKLKDGTAEQSS